MHARDLCAGSQHEEHDDRRKLSQRSAPQQLPTSQALEPTRGFTTDHSKAEATGSRPCGVTQPPDAHTLRREPWAMPEHGTYRYTVAAQAPTTEHLYPQRNISPRQTFQENMRRILVPPRSDVSNIVAEQSTPLANYPLQSDQSISKNFKPFATTEPKYCEGSYLPSNSQLKQQRPSSVRNSEVYAGIAMRGWPNSAAYYPPEYCVPHQSLAVPRPTKLPLEKSGEELHSFTDNIHRSGLVRYDPYPIPKDRNSRSRYEHVNFPNSYQPYIPNTHRYDSTKAVTAPAFVNYMPQKYVDPRIVDPNSELYSRPAQHVRGVNVAQSGDYVAPKFMLPTAHYPLQSKSHGYPVDASLRHLPVPVKGPYDVSRSYYEYDYGRMKPVQMSENPFMNEIPPYASRPQLPTHNYQLHNAYPKNYFYQNRNENIQMKTHTEHLAQYKYADIRHNTHNPLARIPTQFSPNIISPSESNTSIESVPALGTPHEDCGYASQGSTASGKSLEIPHYKIQQYAHSTNDNRTNASLPSNYIKKPREYYQNNDNTNIKDSKNIDVRQFLQMWDEHDEDEVTKTKDTTAMADPVASITIEAAATQAGQQQLYVLDLVNIPKEEIDKYGHIQKVCKLPENIRGYDSADLLNKFDEAFCPSASITFAKQATSNMQQEKIPPKSLVDTARPPSPFDIEAKITQSIIHKDVGCNFEIKPCSPPRKSLDDSSTIKSDERKIEKIINQHIDQPITTNPSHVDIDKNALKFGEKRRSLNNDSELGNAKVVKTIDSRCQFNGDKDIYEIHKKEYGTVSKECLASLPRLDNEMEYFTEINQQYSESKTKKESVIISTTSNALITAQDEEFNENSECPKISSEDFKNDNALYSSECSNFYDSEAISEGLCGMNNIRKLSKFRKTKSIVLTENLIKNAQTVDSPQPSSPVKRTDSVIIKNPDSLENSLSVLNECVKIPPSGSLALTVPENKKNSKSKSVWANSFTNQVKEIDILDNQKSNDEYPLLQQPSHEMFSLPGSSPINLIMHGPLEEYTNCIRPSMIHCNSNDSSTMTDKTEIINDCKDDINESIVIGNYSKPDLNEIPINVAINLSINSNQLDSCPSNVESYDLGENCKEQILNKSTATLHSLSNVEIDILPEKANNNIKKITEISQSGSILNEPSCGAKNDMSDASSQPMLPETNTNIREKNALSNSETTKEPMVLDSHAFDSEKANSSNHTTYERKTGDEPINQLINPTTTEKNANSETSSNSPKGFEVDGDDQIEENIENIALHIMATGHIFNKDVSKCSPVTKSFMDNESVQTNLQGYLGDTFSLNTLYEEKKHIKGCDTNSPNTGTDDNLPLNNTTDNTVCLNSDIDILYESLNFACDNNVKNGIAHINSSQEPETAVTRQSEKRKTSLDEIKEDSSDFERVVVRNIYSPDEKNRSNKLDGTKFHKPGSLEEHCHDIISFHANSNLYTCSNSQDLPKSPLSFISTERVITNELNENFESGQTENLTLPSESVHGNSINILSDRAFDIINDSRNYDMNHSRTTLKSEHIFSESSSKSFTKVNTGPQTNHFYSDMNIKNSSIAIHNSDCIKRNTGENVALLQKNNTLDGSRKSLIIENNTSGDEIQSMEEGSLVCNDAGNKKAIKESPCESNSVTLMSISEMMDIKTDNVQHVQNCNDKPAITELLLQGSLAEELSETIKTLNNSFKSSHLCKEINDEHYDLKPTTTNLVHEKTESLWLQKKIEYLSDHLAYKTDAKQGFRTAEEISEVEIVGNVITNKVQIICMNQSLPIDKTEQEYETNSRMLSEDGFIVSNKQNNINSTKQYEAEEQCLLDVPDTNCKENTISKEDPKEVNSKAINKTVSVLEECSNVSKHVNILVTESGHISNDSPNVENPKQSVVYEQEIEADIGNYSIYELCDHKIKTTRDIPTKKHEFEQQSQCALAISNDDILINVEDCNKSTIDIEPLHEVVVATERSIVNGTGVLPEEDGFIVPNTENDINIYKQYKVEQYQIDLPKANCIENILSEEDLKKANSKEFNKTVPVMEECCNESKHTHILVTDSGHISNDSPNLDNPKQLDVCEQEIEADVGISSIYELYDHKIKTTKDNTTKKYEFEHRNECKSAISLDEDILINLEVCNKSTINIEPLHEVVVASEKYIVNETDLQRLPEKDVFIVPNKENNINITKQYEFEEKCHLDLPEANCNENTNLNEDPKEANAEAMGKTDSVVEGYSNESKCIKILVADNGHISNKSPSPDNSILSVVCQQNVEADDSSVHELGGRKFSTTKDFPTKKYEIQQRSQCASAIFSNEVILKNEEDRNKSAFNIEPVHGVVFSTEKCIEQCEQILNYSAESYSQHGYIASNEKIHLNNSINQDKYLCMKGSSERWCNLGGNEITNKDKAVDDLKDNIVVVKESENKNHSQYEVHKDDSTHRNAQENNQVSCEKSETLSVENIISSNVINDDKDKGSKKYILMGENAVHVSLDPFAFECCKNKVSSFDSVQLANKITENNKTLQDLDNCVDVRSSQSLSRLENGTLPCITQFYTKDIVKALVFRRTENEINDDYLCQIPEKAENAVNSTADGKVFSQSSNPSLSTSNHNTTPAEVNLDNSNHTSCFGSQAESESNEATHVDDCKISNLFENNDAREKNKFGSLGEIENMFPVSEEKVETGSILKVSSNSSIKSMTSQKDCYEENTNVELSKELEHRIEDESATSSFHDQNKMNPILSNIADNYSTLAEGNDLIKDKNKPCDAHSETYNYKINKTSKSQCDSLRGNELKEGIIIDACFDKKGLCNDKSQSIKTCTADNFINLKMSIIKQKNRYSRWDQPKKVSMVSFENNDTSKKKIKSNLESGSKVIVDSNKTEQSELNDRSYSGAPGSDENSVELSSHLSFIFENLSRKRRLSEKSVKKTNDDSTKSTNGHTNRRPTTNVFDKNNTVLKNPSYNQDKKAKNDCVGNVSKIGKLFLDDKESENKELKKVLHSEDIIKRNIDSEKYVSKWRNIDSSSLQQNAHNVMDEQCKNVQTLKEDVAKSFSRNLFLAPNIAKNFSLKERKKSMLSDMSINADIFQKSLKDDCILQADKELKSCTVNADIYSTNKKFNQRNAIDNWSSNNLILYDELWSEMEVTLDPNGEIRKTDTKNKNTELFLQPIVDSASEKEQLFIVSEDSGILNEIETKDPVIAECKPKLLKDKKVLSSMTEELEEICKEEILKNKKIINNECTNTTIDTINSISAEDPRCLSGETDVSDEQHTDNNLDSQIGAVSIHDQIKVCANPILANNLDIVNNRSSNLSIEPPEVLPNRFAEVIELPSIKNYMEPDSTQECHVHDINDKNDLVENVYGNQPYVTFETDPDSFCPKLNNNNDSVPIEQEDNNVNKGREECDSSQSNVMINEKLCDTPHSQIDSTFYDGSACYCLDNSSEKRECLLTEGSSALAVSEPVQFTVCLKEIDSGNALSEDGSIQMNVLLLSNQSSNASVSNFEQSNSNDGFKVCNNGTNVEYEEMWIDDVACIETVVSEDVPGEESESEDSSCNSLAEAKALILEIENSQMEKCKYGLNFDYTKIKNIYGNNMDNNDINLVETLYRTPYMDVQNKLNDPNCVPFKPRPTALASDSYHEVHKNDDQGFSDSQFNNTSDDIASVSNVFSGIKVHSDVVTEIVPYMDVLTEATSLDRKYNKCEVTNSCTDLGGSRKLITKAAQKYIPPLRLSSHDLKVKLSLPEERLQSLKHHLKTKQHQKHERSPIPKLKINTTSLQKAQLDSRYSKKIKPKFEDVLKHIDDAQYCLDFKLKKNKRDLKAVPKVIIKKNQNGSHYTSTAVKRNFNPDLTGNKWQPWVRLEKCLLIDRILAERKVRAVFCHKTKQFIVLHKNHVKEYPVSPNFRTKPRKKQPLKCTITLNPKCSEEYIPQSTRTTSTVRTYNPTPRRQEVNNLNS